MKLLLIADIDDHKWKYGAGQADLILSLGDMADQLILEAGRAYNCPNIFAVRGNHDYNDTQPFPAPITDLHLMVREFQGLRFGGLNGALNTRRHAEKHPFLYDQSEVCRYMSAFPAVDILISHNSPRGVHERNDGAYAGFDGLTNYIIEHQPKFLFHGHQHINQETNCYGTRVICVFGVRELEI